MEQSTLTTNETIENYIDRANKLRQEGKLDEAITVYQRAIEIDPKSYQSYHYIGETLAQKDELDAAANFYNLALEINPEFFWSYHCLGLVLLWQAKFDEAIACFEKAISIEPNRPEFYDHLRLAKAEKRTKKVVEPLNLESLINNGTEGIYSRIADSFYWELKAKSYEPIPPQKLIFYSGSNNIPHYIDNMLLYSKDIIKQCMLKRNHKVWEIGCGAGRIANGLSHYLNREGEYVGIDVNPEIINWCNKFISNRHNNFKFARISVDNNYYYEKSNNKINKYDFSYLGNRQFDCAIAVSVFNHLRIEDTKQYLQEISKRLKIHGIAYLTLFVIDRCFFDFQKRTKTHRNLKKDKQGVWYGYERQSSFTGYEIKTIKELLDETNLKIVSYHPGNWAQKKRSRLFPDLLLVERSK